MRKLAVSATFWTAIAATAIPEVVNNLSPHTARSVNLEPFQKKTFQPFPPEKAQADAANLGVFQPAPDNATAKASSGGKTTSGAHSDFGAAATCTNPAIRVEWRSMTEDDKSSFISAIKCLLNIPSAGSQYPGSQSRYEDLVSVHQQMTNDIHMVGQFLPWHRYYLSIYESMLRQECQYGGAMPWWDETKDAGNFAASPLFTDEYFGVIPMKTQDGQGTCVTGNFGITLHIGPGGDLTDHCLSRALDDSLTANCNADFTNNCNSYTSYADMESCTEGGPHAYGHNGIGAVMSDVASSPGDPIFFMHHTYVDHSWRIWQNADPARLSEVGGNTKPDGSGATLTLDYVLSSRGLRDDVTVRDVMDTVGGYLCYGYDY